MSDQLAVKQQGEVILARIGKNNLAKSDMQLPLAATAKLLSGPRLGAQPTSRHVPTFQKDFARLDGVTHQECVNTEVARGRVGNRVA